MYNLQQLDTAARSWEDQGGQSEKCPEFNAIEHQKHFKMVLVFIPKMSPEKKNVVSNHRSLSVLRTYHKRNGGVKDGSKLPFLIFSRDLY